MATTTLVRPAARVTRTSRQQWDAALQEHRSAQAAADAICGECQRSAGPLSKPIEDERERLVNLADDLHSELLRVPAPDGEALLFKLEYLLQLGDTDTLECWTGKIVTPAVEDARRLLAGTSAGRPAGSSAEASEERVVRMEQLGIYLDALHRSITNDLMAAHESGPNQLIVRILGDALTELSIAEEHVAELQRLVEAEFTAFPRGE